MGDLYTGTKLETAEPANSALHTTAPAPNPTVARAAATEQHANISNHFVNGSYWQG
jgi:hypothetical protein